MPHGEARQVEQGPNVYTLTHAANADVIALHLKRDYWNLMQFWQVDLNCCQQKAKPADCFMGRLSAADLQASLRKFVEYYVLCRLCGSWHTDFAPNAWKRRVLRLKCRDCGKKKRVKSGDHCLDKQIITGIRLDPANTERVMAERARQRDKQVKKLAKK